MRNKNTVIYRGNTKVSVDFSSEEISSNGSVLLLEKLEQKNKLIRYFSKLTPVTRVLLTLLDLIPGQAAINGTLKPAHLNYSCSAFSFAFC